MSTVGPLNRGDLISFFFVLFYTCRIFFCDQVYVIIKGKTQFPVVGEEKRVILYSLYMDILYV